MFIAGLCAFLNNQAFTLRHYWLALFATMQLDPTSVWLREEYRSHAFFPEPGNASFDLPADAGRTYFSLTVEGSPVLACLPANIHVSTPGTGAQGSGATPKPLFQQPGYKKLKQ